MLIASYAHAGQLEDEFKKWAKNFKKKYPKARGQPRLAEFKLNTIRFNEEDRAYFEEFVNETSQFNNGKGWINNVVFGKNLLTRIVGRAILWFLPAALGFKPFKRRKCKRTDKNMDRILMNIMPLGIKGRGRWDK